mgnify:CR=1 FL=1
MSEFKTILENMLKHADAMLVDANYRMQAKEITTDEFLANSHFWTGQKTAMEEVIKKYKAQEKKK